VKFRGWEEVLWSKIVKMEADDAWTTIDRKANKKKSSKEEAKSVADDGWEQVNKKDKKKKDLVSNNINQQNHGGTVDGKGRNGGGQRGGRGRGGSDAGSNKGTLPRKNSGKPPPRGGSNASGRGGPRGSTQSPAGRGGSRGVTPQPRTPGHLPSPAPAPVPTNTWAAKLSGTAPASQDHKPSEPAVAPSPKFSWANLSSASSVTTQSSSSRTSIASSTSPIPSEPAKTSSVEETVEEPSITNHVDENNATNGATSDKDTDIAIVETVDSVNNDESKPTNEKVTIPTENNVDSMHTPDAKHVESVIETKEDKPEDAKIVENDTSDKIIDNGTATVIDGSKNPNPDSNGNFATDDNKNITDTKCFAHENNDKIQVEAPLTNGDISTETEAEASKAESFLLNYKDDQWSPLNTDGKKQYDRDFLMSLQTNALSLQKPETLPNNIDVILDSPNLRNVTSAPNLKMMDHPAIRSSASHSRTPRRGDSRRKESRLGAGKVIELQREEIKLNEAENAWKPSKKEAGEEDDVEVLCKKIRSILNKLCPQKFDKLVAQFKDLVIDNEAKLTKAMELVFEKALDEPVFSIAYARMCKHLVDKRVLKDGRPLDFRTLLLQRCQYEFKKDYMEDLDKQKYEDDLAKAESEDEKKNITAEFEAQEMKLRRRSLGNIRFIGELYKIGMLHGKIMHECIRKLLQQTDEESLECLCRLVTTVGQALDQKTNEILANNKSIEGINSLDVYFDKMNEIIREKKTSARVRFLMQDVIDLRKANWVKRREEAGPKTIDQIHNDAKKEEIRTKIANMTEPPPPRKSEDRRRSQMARKESRQDQRQDESNWNNVPTKAAKIQERPDISKIRISKVDINSMSFGPPKFGGGMAQWGRGSNNKKMSAQEPPLRQANRFAGLLDDEGDNSGATPHYHGRASEPAFSNTRTMGYHGARSRDSSLRQGASSRDGSRDGMYSGRSSRDSVGAGVMSRRDVITEDSVNTLRGDADVDRDKLETKTRNILEEYLNNVDPVEAFTCIQELYHMSNIHLLVEFVFNMVVEKKENDRVNAGKLFAYLLRNESLPRKEFLNGVESVLEFAEDLLIDIPQFWGYFGVMIATIVLEKVLDVKFIQESSGILKANNLDSQYVRAILCQMTKLNSCLSHELWSRSGFSLKDFNIPEDDANLSFLNQPLANGTSEKEEVLEESFEKKLKSLLSQQDVNQVFNLIDNKFGSGLDNATLRMVIGHVTFSCIDNVSGNHVLNEGRLKAFGVKIMKKYVDAATEQEKVPKELQALFSLQSLVTRLEHPNKLLHSIFDVLYEVDIISEDAFLEWETNEDPEEQEGKGVALKSCTQFFEWLKTAETEDDDEEKQRQVSFKVGDDS